MVTGMAAGAIEVDGGVDETAKVAANEELGSAAAAATAAATTLTVALTAAAAATGRPLATTPR